METYLTEMVQYLACQSWQIAVLTLAIAAATFALRRRSAHVRYLLWLIVLAKCLVPPLYMVPLRVLPPAGSGETRDALLEPDWPLGGSGVSTPVSPDRSTVQVQESTPPAQEPIGNGLRLSASGWLGILWIFGAGTYLTTNLLRALRGHHWLRKSRTPLPATMEVDTVNMLRVYGLRRLPRIWMVEGVGQPFVWGLVRGSIYVPPSFLPIERPEHQRNILAHEISHVLRFDAAVNIFQVIAQGLFWFHPFVWWANRWIRVEREKCCDEAAIVTLGASPQEYGTAIIETLAASRRSLRPVPSLAVAGPARNIEERIKTMMSPGKRFRARPGLAAVAAVMSAATLVVPTTITFTARAEAQSASVKPSAAAGRQVSVAGTSVGSTASTASGAGRMLHFPGERPVGQLRVQDEGTGRVLTDWFHWAGVNGRNDIAWDYFCEAQGDVHIPAGKRASLTVNTDSWGDLSWLMKLQPDDLYGLGFVYTDRRVKAGDARLKPVTYLTGLRELSLDNTDITDLGMSMLSSFPSLEELGLNSRVTDQGMVHVAQLKSLKRLYFLGTTKVTSAGLQHISKLTSLEELYLGQGIGDAGLAHLRGLPHLTYLCLYGPGFTDAGMVHVKAIPSLRIFSIHEAYSRVGNAGLAQIAELPNLGILCVGGMRGITDAGIAHLTKMRSLRKLDIGSSQVSDKGLAYLKQIKTLEHLDLPQEQHNISDAGLAHLAELSNLKVLQVSRAHSGGRDRNQIHYTDAGLAELAKLRSLEELHVGSIGITDAGMDHIAKLTNLKTLHMFGCDNVTDRGIARLTALKSLTNLDLSYCRPTIAGLAVLNSLTSLTKLDVDTLERSGAVLNLSGLTNLEELGLGFGPYSQDAFNDADLACLANLKKLRWLQIGPRNFTDQGMLYLAGLTNIDRLGLGGAGLTDEDLKRLANLKKLDLLTILGRFDKTKRDWGSGGHITDKGLGYLENFKQLSYIEIYSDSNFSDEAIQRLYEQLPNLYRLNLNGSDKQPTAMGGR